MREGGITSYLTWVYIYVAATLFGMQWNDKLWRAGGTAPADTASHQGLPPQPQGPPLVASSASLEDVKEVSVWKNWALWTSPMEGYGATNANHKAVFESALAALRRLR